MRKYSCEFGLNVYSSYKTIIPIEYLDMVEDNKKYHIYGILATPKVFINPETINCNENGLNMELKEIENGNERIIKINNFIEFPGIDYRLAEINTKYPYSRVDIKFPIDYLENLINKTLKVNTQQMESLIKYLNSTRDAQYFAEYNKSMIDMEVLYIGQAFGNDGERTALHRLKSHEKLQKILIDCNSIYPDKRIYIMLLEMTPILNSMFHGNVKEFICNEEESQKHIEDVMSNQLRENQIINITEAAIINYFKPPYNTNFIENFPSNRHKGYKQYYDLDYNAICVEIDMEFDNHYINLFSNHNKLGPYNYIRYKISNDPNVDSIYDVLKNR